MKNVIIIAGPNGSGKSTFALNYLKNRKLTFINADDIASKINPRDVNAVKFQAGKRFLNRVQDHIKNEQSFAIETTLSGKLLSNLVIQLKKNKYTIELIYIFVENPDILIDRIKIRVIKGGHHIPNDIVVRRFQRSKFNFWNEYRKIVDSWQILYNGGDLPLVVAIGKKNIFSVFQESLFKNFLKDV